MIENSENANKKKNRAFVYFLVITALVILIWFGYSEFLSSNAKPPTADTEQAGTDSTDEKFDKGFVTAVTSDEDTNYRIIHVSALEGLNQGFDTYAGQPVRRVYSGRRVNIAVTGLDSRMGTIGNHADANHILSIMLDSGAIEIISIPRDTPADAGLSDTSNQNKLTIVRAVRGRQAYHEEAALIAGLDKIHYWVELNFSQAMGLIEWLGFSKPATTLQVLRSRTGLGGDDYQRCYNQAQFMKQMMTKHFDKFTGMFADVFIRGGLAVVDNNLSAELVKSLISQLTSKGFPNRQNSVTIKVRPPLLLKFKVYDFSDEVIISHLEKKIERFNEVHSGTFTSEEPSVAPHIRAVRILNSALSRAVADSAKKPDAVIRALKLLFEQRAWLQVRDLKKRDEIRSKFGQLLSDAYIKKRQFDKAREVLSVISAEKQMFEHKNTPSARYDTNNLFNSN